MSEVFSVEFCFSVALLAGFVFACIMFSLGELVRLVSTYISRKLKDHRNHFDCKQRLCCHYGSVNCFDPEYVSVEGHSMVCRCKNYTPQNKE